MESNVAELPFFSTGGFELYADQTYNLNTEAGVTEIRIEASTAMGLANVDYAKFSEASAADCGLTPGTYPIALYASSQQGSNSAQKNN